MHLISTLSLLENLTQSVCGLVRSAPLNASRRMASWECEASCPSDKKEVSSVHKLWFPQDNTGSRLYQRDNVIINIIWHKMSKAKSRGKEKYQLAGQGVYLFFSASLTWVGLSTWMFITNRELIKRVNRSILTSHEEQIPFGIPWAPQMNATQRRGWRRIGRCPSRVEAINNPLWGCRWAVSMQAQSQIWIRETSRSQSGSH